MSAGNMLTLATLLAWEDARLPDLTADAVPLDAELRIACYLSRWDNRS